MTTKTNPKRRYRGLQLTRSARLVLFTGVDLLGDFLPNEDGEARARAAWEQYGRTFIAETHRHDQSIFPAAFFWFSRDCPQELRVPWPKCPPTGSDQRRILLKAKLLSPEGEKQARDKLHELERWIEANPKSPSIRWEVFSANPYAFLREK